MWLRFRFHDPAKSHARDLCRLVATVMLQALKDPDVQRYGITVIQVLVPDVLSIQPLLLYVIPTSEVGSLS
ncbi:MAG: hypothetical protein HC767_09810 [Akkermansiaceae bacterium]|nr:hypothetical protein [Akkermansiaceae bacterium]